MTDFQEFTFLSSDGHTRLHGAQWAPADREPIAVLQIAHGVAEHILRYDGFARYLNEQGILVAGHDHLGHGKSLPQGQLPQKQPAGRYKNRCKGHPIYPCRC